MIQLDDRETILVLLGLYSLSQYEPTRKECLNLYNKIADDKIKGAK